MSIITRMKIILSRMAIRTIGQSSRGIRMVTSIGLTSGIMLDYIYQNQPQGSFLIGRWLDKIYLSHPAWEDVRIRKRNLEQYLLRAVQIQEERGEKPVILDVAAGSARYLLDVLSQNNMSGVQAICRDLDRDALNLGRQNAVNRGLTSVRFETGDAFNQKSLAGVERAVNIVVSSGFYDWITDDDLVRKSMLLIYDLLPRGGSFVFTNQSRHPSLEFTQQVFSDYRGEPLRMTLRPVQQVNAWAEDAGFKIIKTTGDEQYNYSVTLATKPE